MIIQHCTTKLELAMFDLGISKHIIWKHLEQGRLIKLCFSYVQGRTFSGELYPESDKLPGGSEL